MTDNQSGLYAKFNIINGVCPRCKTTLLFQKCRNVDCENYDCPVNVAITDDRKGLYEKYKVIRSDTGEIVPGAFVLRPDTDFAARCAILEYAMRTDNEALASDLFDWVERIDGTPEGVAAVQEWRDGKR